MHIHFTAYVDNNLVGTKNIKAGAIFGLAGGKWACSGGFNITDAEAAAFVKGFSDTNGIRANAPTIAGEKYLIIKADDQSIYGKKGKEGCVAVKYVLSTIYSLCVGLTNVSWSVSMVKVSNPVLPIWPSKSLVITWRNAVIKLLPFCFSFFK